MFKGGAELAGHMSRNCENILDQQLQQQYPSNIEVSKMFLGGWEASPAQGFSALFFMLVN